MAPDGYVDSGCTQPIPVVDDLCEKCKKRVRIGDFPFCPHESTVPSRPFPEFEYEGRTITDLGQIRKIERESMEKYSAGEKVAPVVWRDFSNDRSNRDSNVFGRPSYPGKPNAPNIKLRSRKEP